MSKWSRWRDSNSRPPDPQSKANHRRPKMTPRFTTVNVACNWGDVSTCIRPKLVGYTTGYTAYSSSRNSLIAALITHALAVSRTPFTSLQLSILHPSCRRVFGGGRRFHLWHNPAAFRHYHSSHLHLHLRQLVVRRLPCALHEPQ